MYTGQYVDDKKEGFGIYLLPDGRRYEGWWVNGKQHGIGTFHFIDSKNAKILNNNS